MKPKQSNISLKNNKKISHLFVKLGLSPAEATCYKELLTNGALPVIGIANKMKVFPTGVYRLIKKLIGQDLIIELDTFPTTYQAVPFQIALNTLSSQRINEIEEAKMYLSDFLTPLNENSSQIRIETLTGRISLMDKYIELAKNAQEEILIISIGESVGDEVKLINRDALERGVIIKFIVHKFDNNNVELLNTYIKMGLEVKYFKDSGYHLIIVDGEIAILATSNPKNTEERTSMVIHSEGLTNALQKYFYTIWVKSKSIGRY